MGAGGLGSYVGALLARAGHQVTLVTRGKHLEAIRRDGLHVHTVAGDFDVHPKCAASALDLRGADLTFVTVKAYSLGDVADQVAHLARAGSIVVPLLNGVTAADRLVERGVARDRIVEGIAYMTAFRTEPGRIERKADHHRLLVGSSTGGDPEAIGLIEEAFADTDVEVVVSDDIAAELWMKMAVVCALCVLCGLTGKSMGPIREHRLGADLQKRAIAEVTSVARAQGVELPREAELTVGAALDAFPSGLRSQRDPRPAQWASDGNGGARRRDRPHGARNRDGRAVARGRDRCGSARGAPGGRRRLRGFHRS